MDFASEIGDDTMPFTEIKTGTPEELSEDLKAAGVDYGGCDVHDGHFIKTGSGTSVIVTK